MPHPGLVPDEEVTDAPVLRYRVHALVMHVVRGRDRLGEPIMSIYNRGDIARVTAAYAEPYVKARLLESLPDESTVEAQDDEPKPPRRKESPTSNEDES